MSSRVNSIRHSLARPRSVVAVLRVLLFRVSSLVNRLTDTQSQSCDSDRVTLTHS